MSGRIQGAGGLLALLALLSLPGVAGGPGGKEPATPSERRLRRALLLPGDDRDDAVAEAIRSGLSPENGKRYRFVGFLETLEARCDPISLPGGNRRARAVGLTPKNRSDRSGKIHTTVAIMGGCGRAGDPVSKRDEASCENRTHEVLE